MVVERDEAVVLDMEAGIEHLTRGTAESVDAFIVVVEPGGRSVQTAHTVERMAGELGIKNVLLVANKVRGDEDIAYIQKNIGNMKLIGHIGFDPAIMEADMKGTPAYETSTALVRSVTVIKEKIENLIG